MDKLFSAIDLSNVNVYDAREVKPVWEANRDKFNKYLSKYFIYPTDYAQVGLIQEGFKLLNKYYMHPCLQVKPVNNKSAKWYIFITKCALLEVKYEHKGTNLGKFIYQYDKECNRVPRGIPVDQLDRLDQFRCDYENKDEKIIRHFGTNVGNEAYRNFPKNKKRTLALGVSNRANNRQSNKPFIKGLSFGFGIENEYRKLTCPITGDNIADISFFNEETKTLGSHDIFEMHHAKYDPKTGSYFKSASPSEYLNNQDFSEYSHELVEEFLGMVPVSENGHKLLHKSHKRDSIANWIIRAKEGRCIYIPFHWRSEENYKKTIAHLGTICKNFNPDKTLTYLEFIKKHSFKECFENLVLAIPELQSLKP